MVDTFGVRLQDDSFGRLPVTLWLADESQLPVQVVADGVVVGDAHRHGVEAVRARPPRIRRPAAKQFPGAFDSTLPR